VGRVSFDNEASLIADHFGANTQGADSHYDLTLARLQQLDHADALYFAFTGQLARCTARMGGEHASRHTHRPLLVPAARGRRRARLGAGSKGLLTPSPRCHNSF
jgi:hypothetical protein